VVDEHANRQRHEDAPALHCRLGDGAEQRRGQAFDDDVGRLGKLGEADDPWRRLEGDCRLARLVLIACGGCDKADAGTRPASTVRATAIPMAPSPAMPSVRLGCGAPCHATSPANRPVSRRVSPPLR
jgi:hypothetical protein